MAVCIEYGGGPSMMVKMEASKPKYGAQIVGYTGYIPGMKYTQGANSSTLSHCLAKNIHRHKHPAIGFKVQPEVRSSNHPKVKREIKELKKELSKDCKEQKYLVDMSPGYSGYIPRFEYESLELTYGKATFKSLQEHVKFKKKHKKILDDIRDRQMVETSLQPVACEDEVTHDLNNRKNKMYPCGYPGRRLSLEPPIVGYMGCTPRTKVMQETIGMNHRKEACFGLVTFDCLKKYNEEKLKNPCVNPYTRIQSQLCLPPNPIHRIYMQDGMIPKYKGIVHGNLFTFGKTFGDSTRELEVCYHDAINFGAHQKAKAAMNLADEVILIS